MDETRRHRPFGCGCGVLEDPKERIGAALSVGAVQVVVADLVAHPGLGGLPVGLELGVEVVVEDLAHLGTLGGREEPGDLPGEVPRVLGEACIAFVVIAFVAWFGTVLVDETSPPVGLAGEGAVAPRSGVGDELVLTGGHGGCDPLVGVNAAQDPDRAG